MKSLNRLHSLKMAFSGFMHALKTEINFRIHVSMAALVLISGVFFKVTLLEWALLFGCISSVFITELLNSALEHCVNLVTLEYNEKAKFAKDLAAAAVLVAAIFSAVIGAFIFYPKINHYLS
jgi:undecaprenol kinase